MEVPENSTFSKTLKSYVDEALADLKSNLCDNLYLDTYEECYDYYLEEQLETLLVTRLERMIGDSVTVTKAEVEAEFARALDNNKETFNASSSSYESALTDSLSTTYYHQLTILKDSSDKDYVSSYGFVTNILLKLPEEDVEYLEELITANPNNAEAVKVIRNELISKMQISVSNPNYDEEAVVEDEDGEEIELFDPMMDPANPYNNVKSIGADGKVSANKDTYDTTYEVEGGNNYNQIISFEKNADGEYEIKYNATEHAAMPYLLNKVYAFDQYEGSTLVSTGIIHQIYNSLEQVKAAVAAGDLTQTQGVYYLREVANAWLYLVGDDSGAVSSDSNNDGLGYLITPDTKDSSYLDDFTTYARKLIANGTGSYVAVDNIDEDVDFKGDEETGVLAGDQRAFVVADSFIDSASTGGYAGVFVLLNSYTVWDVNAYTTEKVNEGTVEKLETEEKVSLDMTTATLPLNYVIEYAADKDDVKTIYDVIYDELLTSKQSDTYNLDVNTMGLTWADKIEYNEKAIEALYEDLDEE